MCHRAKQVIAAQSAPFGGRLRIEAAREFACPRDQLVENASRYQCKVGLFQRWLIDEGVNQLALSLVEEDQLRAAIESEESERVKSHEIASLAERWGTYRGTAITDIQIRSWLDQFDGVEDQRLMFTLLNRVRFYSGAVLREKLRVAHGFVTRELAAGALPEEPG